MSNLPDIYIDPDGTIVYRASALGSCMKSLVATRMGIEGMDVYSSGAGKKISQIFDEGHLHEPDILTRIAKECQINISEIDDVAAAYGEPAQQYEVSLDLLPNVKVRGHLDGVGYGEELGRFFTSHPDDTRAVVEAKALGESTYKIWLAQQLNGFYRYRVQLSVYMLATGYPGIFGVKNRNNGQLDIQFYDTPPLSISDLRRRVLLIESAAAQDEFPACDHPSFPCKHHFLHDADETPEVGDADDELLTVLAQDYDRAKLVEEKAKAKKEELRTKLINTLGEKGKWENESYTVRTGKSTRKNLDRDAVKRFIEEHDSSIDNFQKSSEVQTVTVSRKDKPVPRPEDEPGL